MAAKLGVHSEVGKLNIVMVCQPALAHQRLTPGNCHDLLFDDVIWVHEAQKDHYDFRLKMQERGVEVLELHDMLGTTLENKEARKFVLDPRAGRALSAAAADLAASLSDAAAESSPSGEAADRSAAARPTGSVVLLVGPESGFAEDELRVARAEAAGDALHEELGIFVNEDGHKSRSGK